MARGALCGACCLGVLLCAAVEWVISPVAWVAAFLVCVLTIAAVELSE